MEALHEIEDFGSGKGTATTDGGIYHAAAAAALFIFCLRLWWPGVPLYDSIVQYKQVASGIYTDWHPPVMARVWRFLSAGYPTCAPMFALQLGSYWCGTGLLAAALSLEAALELFSQDGTILLESGMALALPTRMQTASSSAASAVRELVGAAQ